MPRVFFESVRVCSKGTLILNIFFSFSREDFCYFMLPKPLGAVTWGWVGRAPLLPLLWLAQMAGCSPDVGD